MCIAILLLTGRVSDGIIRSIKMTSRKIRFLSAAVGAVALIATVAVARTVHTHMAPIGQIETSKVFAPSYIMPSRKYGNVVCGSATSASDCERLEMMLPE